MTDLIGSKSRVSIITNSLFFSFSQKIYVSLTTFGKVLIGRATDRQTNGQTDRCTVGYKGTNKHIEEE
jgi:hypothetical protein